MTTRRAFLQCVALVLALVVSAPAIAAEAGIETAINKAGRQRMLSQRVAKAYLMVGLGVQAEQGQAILRESLATAEQQLAELKQFVANEEARRSLAQLERDWANLKSALSAKPNLTRAHEVYDANEVVQAEAHRLTLVYESLARGPEYRLINIAGRQRMLSQRLAKFYLFHLWGVNRTAAEMELDMARAEFSSGMGQLYATAYGDAAVKDALNRLDAEWIRYRELLANPRSAKEVVVASEVILARCENLVALFERQLVRPR